ncbi:CLIP domain-containing serine protease B4-like [Octopus bimaculoides]|uniref:CLIP domain-containing serine protease B4-like n=1 Tax=Octopus bimaculoides TaxID=37653 RepID=UPI0022E0B27B|nr:CLIP domain-containing serine protease B4-like [Octopus bimaculoides]XP_052824398.1 CLIP domain-containing serine protease B4-like [Octopus bimaculoides]
MEQLRILRFIMISLLIFIISADVQDQAKNSENNLTIERIVNGRVSQNCQFSGIVHINGAEGFQCAGNLLDKDYVLSAGHCVAKRNRSLELSISMGSTVRSEATTNRHVSQIIVHEAFRHDNGNYYNDIALLKMTNSVSYGPCLQSVQLPHPKDSFNRSCIAAGWGKTVYEPLENALQYVTLLLLNNSACLEERKKVGRLVKPHHLCTGTMRKGGRGSTCNGDSGGPLYCRNQKNELVLLGITSFGDKKCSKGTSYYTSVNYFLDWIHEKIQNKTSSNNRTVTWK